MGKARAMCRKVTRDGGRAMPIFQAPERAGWARPPIVAVLPRAHHAGFAHPTGWGHASASSRERQGPWSGVGGISWGGSSGG